MRRFILTGTPGAGKTAILRQLEIEGFGVVEEAATDVITLEQAKGIAEPWRNPAFIDKVVNLQRARVVRSAYRQGEVQFHDRSPICTAALAEFLGYPLSSALSRELERLEKERLYERRVFFIRPWGFVTPTKARRISLEEARRFEALHERTYSARGFDLIFIAPASVLDRVAAIRRAL
ncbi:AAA family ATPase [Reyranella sp.]|jgi:predicted ATPase|uniref:AAA family ATPase n=1 Tax=Reyranella sp. TaxID=1929291 RepID=UPI002F92FA80